MKYRIEFDYTLNFAQTIEATDTAEAAYIAMKMINCGGKAQVQPNNGTIVFKKLDD